MRCILLKLEGQTHCVQKDTVITPYQCRRSHMNMALDHNREQENPYSILVLCRNSEGHDKAQDMPRAHPRLRRSCCVHYAALVALVTCVAYAAGLAGTLDVLRWGFRYKLEPYSSGVCTCACTVHPHMHPHKPPHRTYRRLWRVWWERTGFLQQDRVHRSMNGLDTASP